ncbi:MAG: U32 family peptidase C-terminal domain-containing protein, partial [Bacilli bacterium]|nr:U32 family peptidase C-terminal domain-containing protein [Bacilli bacterium]
GKLVHNDDVFFAMGSRDLCGIKAIPALIDLGVASLKIEGRMKSIYYIATVVRVYRLMIDEYMRTNAIANFSFYEEEIAKAENRTTGSGFLFHEPGINEQLYHNGDLIPTKEFVGLVLGYNEDTKFVKVQQRNYFAVGDTIEVFGPLTKNRQHQILYLQDELGNEITSAPHPLQIVYFQIPFFVSEGEMIRLIASNK